LAGVLLGLTFYTYLPARVMWLALPLLAGYLWLRPGAAGRTAWHSRTAWRGPLLTLLVAAAVAAPLLLYLAANPQLEVRVGELSAPLRAAAGGDFGPLWANAVASLRLFTIEGDAAWRYNLPGRPFLPGPLGWLFYVGLILAGWLAVAGPRAAARLRLPATAAPGAFLALVWLALGMAPVLVTGPGLSTTQAIGAQPAVFLLAALPMGAVWGWAAARGRRWAAAAALAGLLLVAALAVTTARDYLGHWANAPDVRVQYETTMVTALRALDARGGAAAVSTITPGPFHTPAVALLTLRNPTVRPRWFDGRESLLLPAEAEATLLIPGFTPVPAALQPYLAAATLVDELPMRPDDLDRPVRVYSIVGPAAVAAALARMKTTDDGRLTAQFGEHATWLGYDLSTTTARPGDAITLVTAWRLERPLPGAALFAHLDGPAGPLAQADSLGAPGESWLAGDTLLQLHVIPLPGDAAPGTYPLTVGVYTRPDGARLPLAGGGDQLTLTTLTVLPADSDG
ncbi:MAG: hypothetical protein KIT52_08780, partial [Anaerolineae bacterium]|nr:hypothetical protein [Anaerolineae bacterium]